MMNECAPFRNWLLTLADRRAAPLPSDRMIEHLQHCQDCRRRIDALLQELSGIVPAAISCDDALERMAMLIDLERSDGTIAAARLIPDVWQHRITCLDCADHAHDLAQLAQLPADRPEADRRRGSTI